MGKERKREREKRELSIPLMPRREHFMSMQVCVLWRGSLLVDRSRDFGKQQVGFAFDDSSLRFWKDDKTSLLDRYFDCRDISRGSPLSYIYMYVYIFPTRTGRSILSAERYRCMRFCSFAELTFHRHGADENRYAKLARYFHLPARNRHGRATSRRDSISGCVVPDVALSSRIYLLLENASISVPIYHFRAVLNFRWMRSVHHSYTYTGQSWAKTPSDNLQVFSCQYIHWVPSLYTRIIFDIYSEI